MHNLSDTTPILTLEDIVYRANTFTHLTPAEKSAFLTAHTLSATSITPPPPLSAVLLTKRRGQAAFHAISTRVSLVRSNIAFLRSFRWGNSGWANRLEYLCLGSPNLDIASPLEHPGWHRVWRRIDSQRCRAEKWDGAFPVAGKGAKHYFERLAGFLEEAGMGKGRTWESLSVDEKKKLYGMVWMWVTLTGLASDGARRIEAGEVDADVWSKDRRKAAAAAAKAEAGVEDADGDESEDESDHDEEASEIDPEEVEKALLAINSASLPDTSVPDDLSLPEEVPDFDILSLPEIDTDTGTVTDANSPATTKPVSTPEFPKRTRGTPLRPAPLVRPLLEPVAPARPQRPDVRLVALGAARPGQAAAAAAGAGAKKRTAGSNGMRRKMGGIKGDTDSAIEMALESWA
ncbi:hypothetical protein HDU96_006270 [Phlyctochytrium bullatum]|nr:hypothetical protein HDU96_006270 [Phlyctochytrium bullatum]